MQMKHRQPLNRTLFMAFMMAAFCCFSLAVNSYPPEREAEYYDILKNIRCLTCEGQSVYDSNSDFSLSIKKYVLERLSQGASKKEIEDSLKKQYGDRISFTPPYKKYHILLWIVPFLLTGIVIAGLLRNMTGRSFGKTQPNEGERKT